MTQTKAHQNWIGILLCIFASCFAAWIFWAELWQQTAHMSDVTFHLSILHSIDVAVKSGGNPVDFWYDGSPFGFALFRGYQHLPHLIVYYIYRACSEQFALESILRVSTCILATLVPCCFFICMRLLGLSKLSAGFSALFSVLVVEIGNYGLGLHNYNWGSGGIIAQLWACCFLLPAVGVSIRYIKEGKYLGLSILLGFCTFGSHVVAIFILGLAIGLYILCEIAANLPKNRSVILTCIKRGLAYFSGLVLVTTHQWLFTLIDAPYLRGSIHEPRWKFESHGINWVLENLGKGNLFDAGRFPGISCFLIVALVFCLISPQSLLRETKSSLINSRWLLLSFVFSISLLCGWELWAWSVELVGILRSLHWHRLIIGVQLFGLILAGIGASIFFTSIRYRSLALILCAGLFYPLIIDRINYYQTAKSWLYEAVEAQQNDSDLPALITKLKSLPRGRIYTGMNKDWANEYKIGVNLALHNVLIGTGLPTYGMLYYPMSLAGDVIFDIDLKRQAQRQMLGVRYFIIPQNRSVPVGLTAVAEIGRYRIFEDTSLTMLDVVDVGFNLTGDSKNLPQAMRNWLQSDLVENKVLQQIPGSKFKSSIGQEIDISNNLNQAAPKANYAGKIIWESPWQVDQIEAEVDLERPAYILFKVPYHPNWQALIDDKQSETVWVSPGFMAVASPAGRHNLKFKYEGSTIKLYLFLLGLLGAMLWAVVERFRITNSLLNPSK